MVAIKHITKTDYRAAICAQMWPQLWGSCTEIASSFYQSLQPDEAKPSGNVCLYGTIAK